METTPNTLETVRHAASEACNTAVGASKQAVQRGVKFVRKNPVGTIAGAVAVGFIVAWALHRRPTWADRNLFNPARRVGGWFRTAADHAADAYHEGRERFSEGADAAVDAGAKVVRKFRFW
jgi:hypothetical protein